MIKSIAITSMLFLLAFVNPAHAEATNTTDQYGREYEDIRAGRDGELDESTLINSDPGHYDGPEQEDSCPADFRTSEDDDQNLIDRARQHQHQEDSGF